MSLYMSVIDYNTDSTLLHTTVLIKQHYATFIYIIYITLFMLYIMLYIMSFMCQWQVCLSNSTYIPHAQISQCASIEESCQCICHIWTHRHKPCDQSCHTQITTIPRMPTMTTMLITIQPNCTGWVGHFQPKRVQIFCNSTANILGKQNFIVVYMFTKHIP